MPVAVQRRVLQLQLAGLGVPAEFELIETLRQSAGRFVSVGPALFISRDAAGSVKLRTQQPFEFKANELTVNLADRAGEVDFAGARFRWDFQSGVAVGRGYQRAASALLWRTKDGSRGRSPHHLEFFDADKVGEQITLRHWRPGDRFQPIGMKSAPKLQDWFVNQRIPRAPPAPTGRSGGGDGRDFLD